MPGKSSKRTTTFSKSSVFNKADVGPHIDALWKACEQYARAKGWQSFLPLVKKLTDLQTAFGKFIALKEAKDELTPAAKSQSQTNDAAFEMARIGGQDENKLKEKDVKDLDGVLSNCGF